MADQDRYSRDRYRDDRGLVERAGDEVRSWFGDDEAARRRRFDEQERGSERQGRWDTGSARWGEERSYSSDREYGDRDYGWRGRGERDRSTSGSREAGAGINWDRQQSSWDRPARPEYRNYESSRADYSRPESSEYSRQTYGGPYGSERFGSREWSSSERWRGSGPYAGKGPRGYQRSDERIREEINDRLTAHGWVDATEIECRVQAGEVTLTGYVDSREAKRAAEDVAEETPGVREVNNQLRVRHADPGVGRTNVLGLNEPQGHATPSAPQTSATTDTTRSRR